MVCLLGPRGNRDGSDCGVLPVLVALFESGSSSRGIVAHRTDVAAVLRTRTSNGPQIRRDYPLSLSISLSGGKETNKDFLSSGERTGKSPA